MAADERRGQPRYPIWLPITVRLDGAERSLPGMLCDVSEGGALVWGYWSSDAVSSVQLELVVANRQILLDCHVTGTENLWDTVILHLRFASDSQVEAADLDGAIAELRENFQSYQRYLAFRADDDPGLARTATQYPGERASA